MKKSSFIESLSKLTAIEKKTFNDFVSSDYWNRNSDIRLLVRTISSYTDLDESPDRNTLWNQIFPAKPFNYNKLRLLFSKSLRLLESFLAIDKLVKDEEEFDLLRMRVILERDMYSRAKKQKNKIQDRLEKGERRDSHYYRQLAELAKCYDRRIKFPLEEPKEWLKHLDVYYYIEKLKVCTTVRTNSKIRKVDYNQPEMDFLEKYFERSPELLDKVPVLKIYFYLYLLGKYPERKTIYFELKEYFKDKSKLVNKSEGHHIYVGLINYAVLSLANDEKQDFKAELYELYKRMINDDVYIKDGYIEESSYRNFILVGLKFEEYSYLEWYLTTYKTYLLEEVRNNAFMYNMAVLNFAQGLYNEASQLLLKVDYTDIYYSVGSKGMLLRIYYDSNEEKLLYSHISTTKIFLKRNKKLMIPYQYRAEVNLFKFAKVLYDIHKKRDFLSEQNLAKRLCKIESEITIEKELKYRDWLVSKLNKIKEGLKNE